MVLSGSAIRYKYYPHKYRKNNYRINNYRINNHRTNSLMDLSGCFVGIQYLFTRIKNIFGKYEKI